MKRLLLTLLPTLAFAQSPDLPAIPDGGQIVHSMTSGAPLATFTHRRGPGDSYTMEYRKGDRLTGPPDETHVYDAKGNMTHRTFANGKTMRYEPHNCARTLGPCSYTQVFPSGDRWGYQRVTTRLPDGTYESRLSKYENGAPEHRETMYLSFFEDGLVARMERRREDGTVSWAAEAERLWAE